jgi:DNA repair exonuclease SbcCD ATPase subunit
MKNQTLQLSIAAALLIPLATGCSDSSTKAAPPTGSTSTMGDKAKDMAAEASTLFADLKRSAETRLAGLDTTIADLRAKAAAQTEDARKDLEDLIAQLEAKKVELQKTLADYDLKKATKDSYENLKTRVDAMIDEINKVVEKAKAK